MKPNANYISRPERLLMEGKHMHSRRTECGTVTVTRKRGRCISTSGRANELKGETRQKYKKEDTSEMRGAKTHTVGGDGNMGARLWKQNYSGTYPHSLTFCPCSRQRLCQLSVPWLSRSPSHVSHYIGTVMHIHLQSTADGSSSEAMCPGNQM